MTSGCPECNPEPATAPVARCRKCGRSECRHDATHHAAQSYDMHLRTECMTCLQAQNRKENAPMTVKRWMSPVGPPEGHDPLGHWLAGTCSACESTNPSSTS